MWHSSWSKTSRHSSQGKKARVKLHNQMEDAKVFEGAIESVVGDLIQLKLADGGSLQCTFEMINKARLAI